MHFKAIIQQKASLYLMQNPANRIDSLNDLVIFDRLLIGYGSAQDPLFEKLKQPDVVAAFHLSPQAWLTGAQTVISFFLGFSESVRKSNRIGRLPSTEWLYGRIEGQAFINTFTGLMVEEISKMGMKAAAPCIHPQYKEINRRSNWSERHVGFICGLGTFGLSESLITDIGSAGRMTSIITDAAQQPTRRKYTDIHENCLWYMNNECGTCMIKCPAQAILKDGKKDKTLCKAYLDEMKAKYHPRYGCGKCQAGMRCESKNPISSLL